MKANGSHTQPYPPQVTRADPERMAQIVKQTKNNPLFKAILKWIDEAVVILGEGRQIVMASDEFAQLAGAGSPEELLGKRIGEALGCVHVKEGTDGCSTSAACRYCGALGAIVSGYGSDEPIESECRLFVSEADQVQSIKMSVRAARASEDEEDFLVLAFGRGGPRKALDPLAQTLLSMRAPEKPRIGPFATLRKLGSGGMGSVYLVRDAEGREYAIKTLREEVTGLSDVNVRFLREARLAVALDHPNIVKTHHADQSDDGTIFIVSEYCPGGSTSEWLQNNGPIPFERALSWLRQAASGLDYMWREHDAIHRDIKPDNLLIGENGELKITDFGIAKRRFETEAQLTAPGNLLGTIHYLAPEQASGAVELDTRADLYALGATFFELLSGTAPFQGANPGKILVAKLFEETPSLSERVSGLPGEPVACIDRLLSRNPSDRYKEPRYLLEALEKLPTLAGKH